MTKANKLVFGLMALFCIDTPAETYSCAAELGRLGGVGEVEQQVFSRKGDAFTLNSTFNTDAPRKIAEESSTDIVLTNIVQGRSDMSIVVTIINKKSLRFTQAYLDTSPPERLPMMVGGKCLRTN
jgi:hypothetical protein